MSQSRLASVYGASALFFGVATLVLAYPLSVSVGDSAMDLGPDTRLFLWTLLWDWHALATKPLELFESNIFFPAQQTLAFSEHLLGAALLASPIYWATGDPLVSMNGVALASVAISGFGTFALARQLGLGVWPAIAAGCIFAFAPPRFFRIGQLHLTSIQWMPLTLAALHRFLETRGRWALVASVFFFSFQALSSGQGALFLLIGACLVIPLSGWTPGSRRDGWFDLGIAGALLLAMNLPTLVPYLDVRRAQGLTRTLEQSAAWEPTPESFLAAPTHAQDLVLSTFGLRERVDGRANAYLFPGWLALALALIPLVTRSRLSASSPREPDREGRPPPTTPARAWVGVLDGVLALSLIATFWIWVSGGVHVPAMGLRASHPMRALLVSAGLGSLRWLAAGFAPSSTTEWLWRRWEDWILFWSRRGDRRIGAYVVVIIIATWAALGPSWGLFGVLHRVFPGFDFIRVPSRITLLGLLGLALVAGFGLETLQRFVARSSMSALRPRMLGVIFCAALMAEYAAMPLDTSPVVLPTSPLDEWLAANTQAGALAHVPSPAPEDEVSFARAQTVYMVYSTAHFRPMVNGYSGFIPAPQHELLRRLASFPSSDAVEGLLSAGVRHILVHRAGYTDSEWDRISERVQADPRLERLHLDDAGAVLGLVP